MESKKVDVNNINAFTNVVVNTLETTCSAKPFRCRDFSKVSGDEFTYNGVLCHFDFTGLLGGSMMLSLTPEVAMKIYGAMMMEEVDEIDEDVADGFAEIGNMIVGNVKADLAECKLDFGSVSVSHGQGEATEYVTGKEWLHIPMAFTDWGEFSLFLNVTETA